VDLGKWAVVACDQYTAQPEYWQKVAGHVGDSPSALNLIFPEVHLGRGDEKARIDGIQQKMREYLMDGVLIPQGPGFMYVNRRTAHFKSRKGLIVALDLECYDYAPGSHTLIRATEGTVLERIPPRVGIRSGALLELPHIMILIDDPERKVIEPAAEAADRLAEAYSVDLMLGGGHVTGYRVTDEKLNERIHQGLESLADPDAFNAKYGVQNQPVLLFAVGDGNHSLATAKTIWEQIKRSGLDARSLSDHPARYALAELVNVHDEGLIFEPIHRALFHVSLEDLWAAMASFYQALGMDVSLAMAAGFAEMRAEITSPRTQNDRVHRIGLITPGGTGIISIKNPRANLAVGTLQPFIDSYLKDHSEVEADYIHGDDVVDDLGSHPGNAGFYLPVMAKGDLFKTVILNGVLPRKTFSMGAAEDKRFYLECRKIV